MKRQAPSCPCFIGVAGGQLFFAWDELHVRSGVYWCIRRGEGARLYEFRLPNIGGFFRCELLSGHEGDHRQGEVFWMEIKDLPVGRLHRAEQLPESWEKLNGDADGSPGVPPG
jgi:hypothetical protein